MDEFATECLINHHISLVHCWITALWVLPVLRRHGVSELKPHCALLKVGRIQYFALLAINEQVA
jgi:hypothetical protein